MDTEGVCQEAWVAAWAFRLIPVQRGIQKGGTCSMRVPPFLCFFYSFFIPFSHLFSPFLLFYCTFIVKRAAGASRSTSGSKRLQQLLVEPHGPFRHSPPAVMLHNTAAARFAHPAAYLLVIHQPVDGFGKVSGKPVRVFRLEIGGAPRFERHEHPRFSIHHNARNASHGGSNHEPFRKPSLRD